MSANLVHGDEPESAHRSYYRVGMIDRTMAALDERSAVGFEAIVELLGHVDRDLLEQAWNGLAARHPILTCVRSGDIWQPTAAPPIGPDEDQPLHHEPPVALRITEIDGGVRLTLLCNHVALDGIASVILLGDLRDAYNDALSGVGSRPADWSPRTLEALIGRDLDWRVTTAATVRSISTWWQAPPSTHVDPGDHPGSATSSHALMEFGPVLRALAPVRRKHHWSTDAVLVGILEKAWAAVFGPPTADSAWMVAQDLRPASGAVRGIGNLSVTAGTSITDPRADLLSVIDQAAASISAQTRDLVTAAEWIPRWKSVADVSFPRMLNRSHRRRYHRSVSNVGQLGESLEHWGSASLHRIWFVGPLSDPPYTSFIAAGHGSSTLVSVRTSPSWLTGEDATALEAAASELVQELT